MNGHRYNDHDNYPRGVAPPRRDDPYRGGPMRGDDPYAQQAQLAQREDPYYRGGGGGQTRNESNYNAYPRAPANNERYAPPPRREEVPGYSGGRVEDPYQHGGNRDASRNAQNGGGGREEDPYYRNKYTNKEDLYSRPHRDRGTNGGTESEGAYNLDHLATFTVGSKQGLMSPRDGIQKLRQMESMSGIWTMRVQLYLDKRDLVIVDKQTGEEMERFPFGLLGDITAQTSQDRRDIYNNILLFTVQQDMQKRAPAEMHIFQVLQTPARDVVDDIKAVVSGQGPRHEYQRGPGRDASAVRAQELANAHAAQATNAYQPAQERPKEAFRKSMKRPDDQDTVISDGTNKEVQLLNHCFDDIERFVGRLQHAAEAFKELDHRRRGRQEKMVRGDGMLTMRARPPPAKDFLDIFQKFKLSFNLLAKLKPHIHDPNAPELVHFLFTPLSLVVEASKEPRHGTPDLATKVISPLLTADAKDLLLNCLTSKEADLWMSLGESWKLSRDEWTGWVPPYVPRFSDGWEPDQSWVEDNQMGSTIYRSRNVYLRSRIRDREYERRRSDEYEREAREREARERESREREAREREARDREARDREAREREARDREAQNREAQNREARDRQAREREARNRDPRQHEGWERDHREHRPPSPPRANERFDPQTAFLRDLQSKGVEAYEVQHDRQGQNDKEITLHKGDIVEVVDQRRNWWKLRNCHGDVGHAPYTIIEKVKDVRR